MSRRFTPHVVTANDLLTGEAIWRTPSGEWSARHREAELFTEAEAAEAALALAQKQGGKAVGAYLAPARAGANGPEPDHFREGFRAQGPSNRPHGKQEAELC